MAGGSASATLVSTVGYLALPGEMIHHGIAYFTSNLILPFVVPVINRIIVPKLRKLPIRSAYEYLEKRFNVDTRKLASGVFIFKTLIWMGFIMYTASFAFAQMTGWSIISIIVVLGVITSSTPALGGSRR